MPPKKKDGGGGRRGEEKKKRRGREKMEEALVHLGVGGWMDQVRTHLGSLAGYWRRVWPSVFTRSVFISAPAQTEELGLEALKDEQEFAGQNKSKKQETHESRGPERCETLFTRFLMIVIYRMMTTTPPPGEAPVYYFQGTTGAGKAQESKS